MKVQGKFETQARQGDNRVRALDNSGSDARVEANRSRKRRRKYSQSSSETKMDRVATKAP
ncbi:hypothetical protein KIN20_010195 [Parelaphostrongylus tenuis]|uniref:Uncharacterized protein n=1 Tax=Parelaphostrongylus tenuis TaxID=148309 RepID=A0AAD5QIP0_PARTN|nr:hypothetical protein KIN20_010195 [Parelaphostrongylus tenuis]